MTKAIQHTMKEQVSKIQTVQAFVFICLYQHIQWIEKSWEGGGGGGDETPLHIDK